MVKVLLCSLIVAFCPLATPVIASSPKAAKPKPQAKSTILPDLRELFASMPPEIHSIYSVKAGKPLGPQERAKLITLEDRKNAYLEVKGNDDTDIFAGGQMTLFKTKSGSFLIGWHADSHGDGTEHIQMLTKKSSTWNDVTADVLPKITPAMFDQRVQEIFPEYKKTGRKLSDCAVGSFAYKLPRKGTTIKVELASDCHNGPSATLWELVFNGESFTIKK